MKRANRPSFPTKDDRLFYLRGTFNSDRFDDGIGNFKEYLTLTHRRNLAADNILFEVQVSSDLISWGPLRTTAVSATSNEDGSETVIWRSLTSIEQQERNFIRLRVAQKP